jgi:hypothetical protein
MKAIGHLEQWGVGVLGVVALALLVNLVLQIGRGRAGEPHSRATARPRAGATTLPSAKPTAGKPGVSDELSRFNSTLELGLLKQLEVRPLPQLNRDPFEFIGAPAKAAPAMPAQAPMAPQPPPPPPITLKPMGYSEGKGGVKEAMVQLCASPNCDPASLDDQVFVVHEGDSVGTRYKVIKITSTVITVEDASIHQTVDLPIPQ